MTATSPPLSCETLLYTPPATSHFSGQLVLLDTWTRRLHNNPRAYNPNYLFSLLASLSWFARIRECSGCSLLLSQCMQSLLTTPNHVFEWGPSSITSPWCAYREGISEFYLTM